jgi:hypothetical protein
VDDDAPTGTPAPGSDEPPLDSTTDPAPADDSSVPAAPEAPTLPEQPDLPKPSISPATGLARLVGGAT